MILEVNLGEALPTGAGPGAGVGWVGRRLRRRRAAVLAVAALHGMTELRVFGSVARGQACHRDRGAPRHPMGNR